MAVLWQCKKDKGKSVPRCAFYGSPHKAGEGLLHGETSFICLGPLSTYRCRAAGLELLYSPGKNMYFWKNDFYS